MAWLLALPGSWPGAGPLSWAALPCAILRPPQMTWAHWSWNQAHFPQFSCSASIRE